MGKYNADEWAMIGINRFGPDRDLWIFTCPACGKTQSVADFVEAGMNPTLARRYAGVHCIGNYYTELANCSHTVDLLFETGKNDIVRLPDGSKISVFPFAPSDCLEWANAKDAREALGVFDKLAKCA
jgi:hypothetical protein